MKINMLKKMKISMKKTLKYLLQPNNMAFSYAISVKNILKKHVREDEDC